MAKIKPIRINIVEEDGWKPWDYAQSDGISSWSADNAWDDWQNMDDETLKGYIEELLEVSLSKAERKRITPEDVDRIAEEIRESTTDSFESMYHAIVDAHQWAWEIAYSPDDRDIGKAMEKARRHWDLERLPDYWDLVLQDEAPEGPREWSPRGHWTTSKLYQDFIERIVYERKAEHYDRYIIFDWGESGAVKLLLQALKNHPEEGSVEGVESDLKDLSDSYLTTFFKELEQRMQDNDPRYHWDLDPHWKIMLKDKSVRRGVRDEVLAFLAKPKKEEVE